MDLRAHRRHVRNGVDPVEGCEWCAMRLKDKYAKFRNGHFPPWGYEEQAEQEVREIDYRLPVWSETEGWVWEEEDDD